MSAPEAVAINLLLFEVGGVPFALDAEQAEEFVAFRGEHDPDLVWFHREMGFREREVVYREPTVVTIRMGTGRPYRVVIDQMQEIAGFDGDDLRLFPPTVEPFALNKGVWGLLPRGGRLVLLVDFRLLLQRKSRELPG